ncbi:MAG TPA: N-6 DNA methylase [Candidatus Paceibacterota bacterium]
MTKEKAKESIQKLIKRYDSLKSEGNIKKFSEEQTKKDFILPLFEALGWAVYDHNEVTAEEGIVGKRVDYGFYLNGLIRFYVEAKSLKADLHSEEYAEQAIRYAWNKGVTWAVLTDFESLIVFNALSPEQSLHGKKYFEIPYIEYLERFDQLWLLSKEAFAQSLLDAEAEKHGKKLEKISVTVTLSKDLNECRQILTKEIIAWNQDVSHDLVDEGVQKLLDRLIFIRAAEDRKIEPPTLRPLIREWEAQGNKKSLYQVMIGKFRELDTIYDSNLFTPHPFEKWNEFGGATKEVIDILYGKNSYYEYDFSVIPADVLGSVYENYLGYKLQKSKEQDLFGTKTEVGKDKRKRKEQGIYYTPKYIVDYIVKHALGPVLDKCQSISDLQKVKVLDPACGSGAFLVAAFNLILEKYKEFGKDPKDPFVKAQVLAENIYGVDLDQQAVEIANLNLLLNTFDSKIKLPNLTHNIRNGNSLVSGTDEELTKYFGKNYRDKKPFNWHEEFPEVFKQGGFDCVIGNPPYIKEFVNKSAFDGLHEGPYYQGKMDIWTMFACVTIDLLKEGGTLSFIAPNNWVTNAGASIFREKILKEGELGTFLDFGDYKVFQEAGIQTMIFVFEKKKPSAKYSVSYLRVSDKYISEDMLVAEMLNGKTEIEIEPAKLSGGNITFAETKSNAIFEKIKSRRSFQLEEKEVAQGIVADPDKAFVFEETGEYSSLEKKVLKNYFTSVGRYIAGERRNLLAYLNKGGDFDIERFPKIKEQLSQYREDLDSRREVKSGKLNWFNLHWPRDEKFFMSGEKIIGGIRVKYPSFYYTEEPYYGSRALNFIKTDRINMKYLTGILNSRLSYFWLKNKGKQLGDLLQVDKGPLLDIPICIGEKSAQKTITDLVNRMLSLHKELHNVPADTEKWKSVKSEIEKTDKKIDAEVYKLYGLTADEIKIVEEVK